MNYTTRKAMDTVIEYRSRDFAIVTNWKNPFVDDIHGDWRKQVRNALSNPKYHAKLDDKLQDFKPIILVYTKLQMEQQDILDLVGMNEATVCVICSSGEHLLTPWMIIHNIGHTVVSWNIWVKDEIMDIIGLTSHDDSVIPIQRDLVNCCSSRKELIPNLNELIYELFTTWVWFGETRSDHRKLREYCNKTFPALMDKYKGCMVWHKYRRPVTNSRSNPILHDILSDLDGDINYVPGVPGFTSKVLKSQDS